AGMPSACSSCLRYSANTSKRRMRFEGLIVTLFDNPADGVPPRYRPRSPCRNSTFRSDGVGPFLSLWNDSCGASGMASARTAVGMQANPRLRGLAVLIGEWTTIGTHPLLPGKRFHGRASFKWLESGAFLFYHSHTDEPEIPDGVSIVGTDDATPDAGTMLYFDVRNVSREYHW